MRYRKGLTLVELAVVISIIGLLMSMVISSLANLIRQSVADTSEKLKSAIQFCYETAILNNQTVILEIDIEEDKYTAYKLNRKEEGVEEKKILESGKLPSYSSIVDITDLRGMKYESGKLRIPFTHNGTAGDYNIHIGDETKIRKTILVYKYRGKIVLKDGEVNRTTGAGTQSDMGKEEGFAEEL